MITFFVMLILWLLALIGGWAYARQHDYEGDRLFFALSWSCLGWVLPAGALLLWVSG